MLQYQQTKANNPCTHFNHCLMCQQKLKIIGLTIRFKPDKHTTKLSFFERWQKSLAVDGP